MTVSVIILPNIAPRKTGKFLFFNMTVDINGECSALGTQALLESVVDYDQRLFNKQG